MTVLHSAGPDFESEVMVNAPLIDDRVIRYTYHYEPDSTGVQWDVSARITYRVNGELFRYDEPIGKVARVMDPKERTRLIRKSESFERRFRKLMVDLQLDDRGAAFTNDRRVRHNDRHDDNHGHPGTDQRHVGRAGEGSEDERRRGVGEANGGTGARSHI